MIDLCDYGCGNIALYTFKKGKKCCSRLHNMCPKNKEKLKISLNRVNLETGLTPLQQREKDLRETIDPETGLSLAVIKQTKATASRIKVDPTTGLNPGQMAQQVLLKTIDPITGLNKKQQAMIESIKILKTTIDETIGLSKWEASRIKSSNTQQSHTEIEKTEISNKRRQTMSEIDKTTGLTKRELRNIKISQSRAVIDPITGWTLAQHIAKKNLENEKWLSNIGRGKASKESLKFLIPLATKLSHLPITLWYGYDTGREWFIKDENNIVRYYDFTIPELKTIVEYNGETYHPNPNKLSDDEWQNWRIPYTQTTADVAYAKDLFKLNLALSKGWEVLYVWSSDNLTDAIEIIYQKINNKYQNLFSLI